MQELFKELFTTDIGLLSLFTIGFVLIMGIYIFNFVRRHVAEDTAAHQNDGKTTKPGASL
ncbi:DUF3149 domain-containing protein [Leeia sp. TBRC 13508]|uniref:DUF3149 domain-containing protein n=1 Tax=Leeia speluncae TaxID=2884804 RepID=A0ABS8D9F0_9NEIS|nr:DUF3149 domain-containing protein [Leeia speluncae]MCB6184839.1 DUF3149 domain-containing protein [Leeia speluncae]